MELFDRDVEFLQRLVGSKRDMKSLLPRRKSSSVILALPGIAACEQLDLPGGGGGGCDAESVQQRQQLEAVILKGLECGSSERLVHVFNYVVNGSQNAAVELLSEMSKKASGTAARARRKR